MIDNDTHALGKKLYGSDQAWQKITPFIIFCCMFRVALTTYFEAIEVT